MGVKNFGGVDFVDAKSPPTLEFQIDRISVYQLDSATNLSGKPMLGKFSRRHFARLAGRRLSD
jgi:hypothetical protein